MATNLVAGCDPALNELARLLAPGRKVRSIELKFNVHCMATAKVEILIEKEDLPAILKAAHDPQIELVEVDPPTVGEVKEGIKSVDVSTIGNPFYQGESRKK